jgi:hypothetical protein
LIQTERSQTGCLTYFSRIKLSHPTLRYVIILHRALQDSADRLHSSFQAHGPEGGYLSTKKARDVLVKTGLEKDQLRKIWNLSDIDRDGLFDHDEYVVAMFLCDAVIQKGRPIPTELPTSVIPPSKRDLVASRKQGGF